MAKKKKRRHRHPVAPPVHSAPEAARSVHPPQPGTRPPQPLSDRPGGQMPVVAEPAVESRARRPQPRRRRRSNRRPWIIAGLVVVAIVAALIARQMLTGRVSVDFQAAAAAADCGEVHTVKDLSRDHVEAKAVKYSTSPPVGGAHQGSTVRAGVYDKPLSASPTQTPNIYQAVHSLEHGYVVIYHTGLTGAERDALENAVEREDEVILVPYSALPKGKKIALTSWGRLTYCGKPTPRVASAFIDAYRNETGPENAVS